MKNVIKGRFGGVKTAEDGDMELVFTVDKAYAGRMKQISRSLKESVSAGKELFKIDITEYRNNRSLEQNALMWALLEKMAVHHNGGRIGGVTAWDCYCDMVESFGARYDYIMALPQTERLLKESFRAVRYVKQIEQNGKTFNIYKCYYGSSTYDTKEMTLLIDGIFDRLAEMGVSDTELYMYKDEWANIVKV